MSDVLIKRARALARSLSEDLRVVGLLAQLPDDAASLEAVVELASSLGRDRRTLLANLAGSSSGLDPFLEAGEAEGLAAVLRGDGKLGEVAIRPGTRPFLYLPAGDVPSFRPWLRARDEAGETPTEKGDAAEGDSALEVLLERLAERIRRAEAVLLLYLPAELARTDLAGVLLDGVVSLTGEAASEARDTGLPVVGVQGPKAPVPTPEPTGSDADAPGSDEGEEPGGGPRPSPRGSSERPRWELEDAGAEEDDGADGPSPEEGPGEPPDREPEATSAAERWGEMARDEAARSGAPARGDVDGEGEDAEQPEAGSGTERRDEEGRWRRHRRPGPPPWGRIALGGLAILVLAVGWWAFARSTSDGSDGAGQTEAGVDVAAVADSVDDTARAVSEEEATAAESRGAAAEEPVDEAPPPPDSVIRAAPELSHSVLVASYANLDQARRRADAWSREDGRLYFVAPTRIDGQVYHRLFSGALATPEAGRRAMRRLVEMGRKDSARAWDLRPTRLAHRLAVTRDEAEANRVREELASGDVPAYVLAAVADGDTVYQVYSGAYERSAQSALGDVLGAMGRDTSLVTRRGVPQRP